MNRLSVLIFISLVFACSPKEGNENIRKNQVDMPDLQYPVTRKSDVVDDYFGTKVKDEYRWLEVDTASEVMEWVDRQNEVTQSYLKAIPFREKIASRYEKIFNFEKSSAPIKAGDYFFTYRNDGLQNQAVIYRQKGLDGEAEVFIDPNNASEDGTVTINIKSISPDNQFMVLSIQEAGSDWAKLTIREVESGKYWTDTLNWTKFSGIAWKNDGFYYSRYPAPEKGLELSKANEFHSIYYHKLGDPQSKDQLIYRNDEKPNMYHWASTTEDERYLVMSASTGTDGYETYFMDLDAKIKKFKPLFTGFANKNNVIDHKDGFFYVHTDIDAPNYRMVKIPVNNPKGNWKEVIPETEDLLESVSTAGGRFFATYIHDVVNEVYSFDYTGGDKKTVELPSKGSVGAFTGEKDDSYLFYTFTSFVTPGNIFKYNIKQNQSELFWKPDIDVDLSQFEEKQIFFTSKDGTKVPLFIVHKKGVALDGNNPTLLYGYGGFNINLTPSFSTSRLIFLENGGIYALANLRGGGEYGENWHKQGMLLNKQNVFDDFISAAEHLISKKYTSPSKLAIQGGSNGGLLVGACMTQRPDLFQVALPSVGVMDMLRYDKFTVGWGWVPEYGSSEDSIHFDNLYSYSPLHNLKPGTEYPATLVMTADHDDRVVPAHSFKFAAKLQECHEGDNPVLIRIEKKAGHGAGKPTSKIIEEQSDIWSFLFNNLNIVPKY